MSKSTDERRCNSCKDWYPLSHEHFYPSKVKAHRGFYYTCRPCEKANARWRAIKRLYGLSRSAYEELLESQGGRCITCQADSDLVVDHCHVSGEVRGILCRKCNAAIGLVHEDLSVLASMIKYLT